MNKKLNTISISGLMIGPILGSGIVLFTTYCDSYDWRQSDYCLDNNYAYGYYICLHIYKNEHINFE